ncbi:MAG: CheR family methyltransferase [Alphaproteobacteria bacterium]
MTPESYRLICELVRRESGLVLADDKAYLLESRLMPVARKWQLADLDAIAGGLRKDPAGGMTRDVVDAMTTNESFFFRDNRPFDQFRDVVLPNLLETNAARRQIRIWSAACSNGQEPYSLSMILKEASAKLAGWKIDIIATDLSREVLARAKSGLYSQFEVQRGLPINYLVKYFKQEGEKWQIDAAIRSMVQFKEFNLLQTPRGFGTFDVVFCRNVLIYFDAEMKSTILGNVADVLAPHGVLYLGGAETVIGVSDRFAPMPNNRGVYELTNVKAKAVAVG